MLYNIPGVCVCVDVWVCGCVCVWVCVCGCGCVGVCRGWGVQVRKGRLEKGEGVRVYTQLVLCAGVCACVRKVRGCDQVFGEGGEDVYL